MKDVITLENIFKQIGFLGPYLLFIYSLYVLRFKTNYLTVYCIGYVINIVLNSILKGIIKHPRPSVNKEILNILENADKYVPFNNYGMPSGHAQISFFTVAYLYMVTKNKKILIFTSILSLITLAQRVYTQKHSIMQVLVGSLVGFFMGFLFYVYGYELIRNQ